MSNPPAETQTDPLWRPQADWPFVTGLAVLSGSYLVLIAAMLVADAAFTTPGHLLRAFASPEIQYSIKLSMISCTLTALLSLWIAVPMGYLMSRFRFPGKGLVDALIDIPIVLPPLVIGLSLLILFQTPIGRAIERHVTVTYAIPSVILAQFSVACAFSVRTMLVTFQQIDQRREQVALTLGASRGQAFWMIALPEAKRGILTAGTLAWARALGEFGPILVFCGTTRMRTEVLPVSVFLELSIGNIEAAVAVSMLMIGSALVVLTITRLAGAEKQSRINN